MAAPSDEFAFDLDEAIEAASRWEQRRTEREANKKNAEERNWTAVEEKGRLAKVANRRIRQLKQVARSLEDLPEPIQDLVQQPEIQAEDVNNELMERVIGATRDFLGISFFEAGLNASRSVCRIVTRISNGKRAFGTGFMVTPHLLITNHHVLPDSGAAQASSAEFNFQLDIRQENQPVDRFALRPDLFFLNDKPNDFALCAVDESTKAGALLSKYFFCPLIGAEGKIANTEWVNIVQHPRGDMKQVVIRENRLLDLPDKQAEGVFDRFAYYAADTEPGSSGSPVFNDLWEVIALHHSSVPKRDEAGNILSKDEKVWERGDDPGRIAWIGNEGIRVSRIVKKVSEAMVPPEHKDLYDEFIRIAHSDALFQPPPIIPIDIKGGPTMNPEKESLGNAAAPVTIHIPITISLSLGADGTRQAKVSTEEPSLPPPPDREPIVLHSMGGAVMRAATRELPVPSMAGAVTRAVGQQLQTPSLPGQAAPIAPRMVDGAEEAAKGKKKKADPEAMKIEKPYDNRKGFLADFLGFSAPLPKLGDKIKKDAAKVGGGVELKYHHYSVIMSASRKTAFVSAVNIDLAAPFNVSGERKDKWYFDSRISEDLQAGNDAYAHEVTDRGHLTRRADAAWGQTQHEANKANADTFHWTNCSIQHEAFNRSTLSEAQDEFLWGSIENHIAAEAKAIKKKLSVFNGPIMRKNDQLHRGILVPKEFFKIVVCMGDDGNPQAFAFKLSQAALITDLPEEIFAERDFEPGEKFEAAQVLISELEKATNLDFGAIRKFDVLAKNAEELFTEGMEPVRVLKTLKDIVI